MKKQIDNTFTEIPKTLLNLVSCIMVNGKKYNNIKEWSSNIEEGDNVIILNLPKENVKKIVVKESALQDTPFFKFNEIYNNNKPIPMREMYGLILENREKMIKMDLWDKDHKIHWVGWLLRSWLIN